MVKITKLDKAFNELREYNGKDPYMLMLKRDVFIYNKSSAIGDFQIDYILTNSKKDIKPINKLVKLADWYGEKKKVDWNLTFTPEYINIVTFLGETKTTYNCIVQYRQSKPPVMCFLPKKAVLNNFLVEDYHNVKVDFDRYDRLSMQKDPNRRLKEHQKESVQFLLSRKKCILALDQGMGKSACLSVAAIEGNYDSVLIVCPASLKINWKNELLWYAPERDITIVDSFTDKNKSELEKFLGYGVGKSGKSKDELLAEAKENGKWVDNRFVIINYEILDEFYRLDRKADENTENNEILKYIKNKKSLIIVDEAHKLSNNSSNRSKILSDLIKKGNPDSLFFATGTPITKSPQNLYCVLKFIGDPITDDWEYYMSRYCNSKKIPAKGETAKWNEIYFKKVGKSNWRELTNEQRDELKEFVWNNCKKITVMGEATNLDELKERISHIYLRRVKEEIGELPPKRIHEIFYRLNLEQKREYNKLWDEYEKQRLSEDPDAVINKDLLEGAVYRRYLSNEMVKNTIKFAEEQIALGNKVVVACCFDEEINALRDYFKERCVMHNGKMSAKQKDISVTRFMTDDSVMVFLGNIISAGVGLTLTSSHVLIFNDFDYVFSNNAQMMDRVHRIGQKHDVDIYVQIYKDTQYEKMWEINKDRKLITETIIKTEDEKIVLE